MMPRKHADINIVLKPISFPSKNPCVFMVFHAYNF